jgi:hypothetical protein
MGYFLVTEECGPAWDASRPRREQDDWDAHAAFMDALVEDAFVVLGGPVGDGARVLLVIEAEDRAGDRGSRRLGEAIEARLGEAIEARLSEAIEARLGEAIDARVGEAVEARLAEDPWIRTGILRVATIEPWEILLDGRG